MQECEEQNVHAAEFNRTLEIFIACLPFIHDLFCGSEK
jgi:hypothetical protein